MSVHKDAKEAHTCKDAKEARTCKDAKEARTCKDAKEAHTCKDAKEAHTCKGLSRILFFESELKQALNSDVTQAGLKLCSLS